MFKMKLSLLLIAILLLNMDFLFSYSAFAQTIDPISGTEGTKFTSRFNNHGRFSRASNPDCGAFKTAAAIAGIVIAIGVVWTAITLIVSSAGLFTVFVIIGVIAAIVGVWKAIGGLIVCNHSFVKHPVVRGSDGKKKDFSLQSGKENYKRCTNKIYKTEEEYFQCFDKSEENGKKIEKDVLGTNTTENDKDYWWPKNAVQYSDYIEICHRNPFTFGSIFNPLKNFDIRERELESITTGIWPYIDGTLECAVLKARERKTIHGSTFQAVKRAGRLCVELAEISWMGIKMNPWPQGINIGCTDSPPEPTAPMCEASVMKLKNKNGQGGIEEIKLSDYKDKDYKVLIMEKEKNGKIFVEYDNKKCFSSYMSSACYNQAGSNSLSPVPITSMLVQCIKESLDNLVKGRDSDGYLLIDKDGNSKGSFLSVAQKRLKNTVTAVLVLALILFAIKVMSGGVRSPQEIYILIIKFALVIYFTTGDTMSHYYEELTRLSNGLSEIVLKASSESKGVCNYEAKDYISSRGNYSYLAPWDKLDCRLLFYLGAPLQGIAGKIGTGGVVTLTALLGTAPVLLVSGLIFGIIFAGGQILVAFVVIFMGILMMMVILWISYIFILSLIALAVIIILSPLFIPMVLFQHTKGYFDGWVRELITYSLYPVILFSFLSFMFIACDKVFYRGLSFEREELPIFGQKKQWFKIKDNGCEKNENTLACMLQNYELKKNSILGLFDFTELKFKDSLIGELLKLCLILFLFYHFMNILPEMAAELAGNHRSSLGSGSTPGQLVGKAVAAIKAIASGPAGIANAAIANAKKEKDDVTGGNNKSRSSGPQGDGSSESINTGGGSSGS